MEEGTRVNTGLVSSEGLDWELHKPFWLQNQCSPTHGTKGLGGRAQKPGAAPRASVRTAPPSSAGSTSAHVCAGVLAAWCLRGCGQAPETEGLTPQ